MKTSNKIPTKTPKIKVKKPNAKGLLKSFMERYGGIILYSLLFILLFVGITFLFGGDNYSVQSYMWTQILVIVCGMLFILGLLRLFEWAQSYSDTSVILFTTVMALVGVGVNKLSALLDILPTLPLSYAWAFILFSVPLFFMVAFEKNLSIPKKVFSSWAYPYGKEVPVVEVINPVKVKFYIAKKKHDDEYAEFALNVPVKCKLGEFMHYFLHRYNYDKNPSAPIYLSDDNTNKDLYQWIFKRKPDSEANRNILDPLLSIEEQGIKEGDSIIVERYEPSIDVLEDDSLITQEDLITELENEPVTNIDDE